MKLEFSILWFDDDEDYYDSLDRDYIEEEIRSWGFVPSLQYASTPEQFFSHEPFQDFDLIVVDKRLEGYDEGQLFIKNMRNKEVFTEVIFYTAGNVTDLWEAIRKEELEGIFVSHKGDIEAKIIKVGHQSVRKVLDLENMRGIVMAEVGELDHLLSEIIELGINSLETEQQKVLYSRFCKKSKEDHAAFSGKLEAFEQAPTSRDLIQLCDSSKRWENFNRLKKCHGKLNGHPPLGDYVNEILGPRNYLAHGRPVKSGPELFTFHFNGREYPFSNSTSADLRRKIIYYKDGFLEIKKILSQISRQ